jgi:L-lactate dehydrogenase complex protein LldF
MSREIPLPVLPRFQEAAPAALENSTLRRNLGRATSTIRARRSEVVGEMPDWEDLREAGRAIKERTLRHLDGYLEQLENCVREAGGSVHWAADAAEANQMIVDIARSHRATEVVKVKSMTTDEIELNDALAEAGIAALETDLAELIVQLAEERSSHILVPAIHKNRTEIRDLFRSKFREPELSDDPEELTAAARRFLRAEFLTAGFAVSGANFAVAETGSIAVVESEGNGRMCLTLPDVLVTVMGIEKVIPSWDDLAVFLQLLPRSSTGERMNPYTSIWTGVTRGDGPQSFHLLLLDNGRTEALADRPARETLACIRCSACLNVCPVYERTGGHPYGSVYPGPIGAILTPQMIHSESAESLPYASSLCGACYEVCPVKIDIPRILVHLRGRIVEKHRRTARGRLAAETIAMRVLGGLFGGRRRFGAAQRLARVGQRPFVRKGRISGLPVGLSGWTRTRDIPPVPKQTFREWWRETRT